MGTMSWESAKTKADSYKAGGNYVRLTDDKDKVIGTPVGGPQVRELHYDERTKTYAKYTAKHKADGIPAKARFLINLYIPAHKGPNGPEPRAVKVFEMSPVTFKDFFKIREKYGTKKWLFEISREGAKGSPKTTYHILPETELTKDHLADIDVLEAGTDESFKLHDLDKLIERDNEDDDDEGKTDLGSADRAATAAGTNGANGHTNGHTTKPIEPPPPAPAAPALELIPSDKAVELTTRLKTRPQDEIQAFLKEFGVKKIKEVPAKDAARAFAYLDSLEGKGAAEDDPFAE